MAGMKKHDAMQPAARAFEAAVKAARGDVVDSQSRYGGPRVRIRFIGPYWQCWWWGERGMSGLKWSEDSDRLRGWSDAPWLL